MEDKNQNIQHTGGYICIPQQQKICIPDKELLCIHPKELKLYRKNR